MPQLILLGVIFFTIALVFYSIGIWSEYFTKRLKKWHVMMFFFGVITDALGTWYMYLYVGHIIFTAHTIAGFIGLLLMVFHFLWALIVVKNNKVRLIRSFHRFSVFVWSVWMVSYLSGLFLGIQMLT